MNTERWELFKLLTSGLGYKPPRERVSLGIPVPSNTPVLPSLASVCPAPLLRTLTIQRLKYKKWWYFWAMGQIRTLWISGVTTTPHC